ncbi:YtxH domain-containing protein [Geomesophilobacter sediminis]|uniref:YtxH domain-containing protein n=1 Tax=Geomesophilobacter sediminis TaxID=2798584 RepID=A0A8J7M0Z0_9BACT|nr:YtxH domain-containing protein [Geomesophilobacter sediminis]MBJ6726598.1 YtxH domain-containing protein [Geomesophilobacter sediminis]
MSEENDGIGAGTVLLSFLAGAAVGVGAALLLAPKSGEELRGDIKDLADDAVSKIKEYASDAQEKIRASYEDGKELVIEKKNIISSAIEAGKQAMEREREKQEQV